MTFVAGKLNLAVWSCTPPKTTTNNNNNNKKQNTHTQQKKGKTAVHGRGGFSVCPRAVDKNTWTKPA